MPINRYQRAANEPVHARTGFYMFAIIAWMLVVQTIHIKFNVYEYLMTGVLTFIASQLNWVDVARLVWNYSNILIARNQNSLPPKITHSNCTMPLTKDVSEEITNEEVLLKGNMNSAGCAMYSITIITLCIFIYIKINNIVYIPNYFTIVLIAFLLDAVYTLLMYGTTALDIFACASISCGGVKISRNIFSSYHEYPLKNVGFDAEYLGFGLVRLVIRTASGSYLFVTDENILLIVQNLKNMDSLFQLNTIETSNTR